MPDAPKAAELCLSCGLCCNGVLHGYVALQVGEVELAERSGLRPYSKNDGEYRFRQPCPCHDGKKCTVYASRPNACRSYECKLLRAYVDESKTFESSAALIAQVKELISSIRRQIDEPPDATRSIWQQVEDFAKEHGTAFDSKEFRFANRDLMMDLASLEALCKKHFMFWSADRGNNIK